LKERFEAFRKKNKKKRLSKEEKSGCCSNEHSTSVVDLLYRLRCRSNYDNPDMYLYGSSDEVAIERYKNLEQLTMFAATGFETILEKALGTTQMDVLREVIE
jgi:hypothetical protein